MSYEVEKFVKPVNFNDSQHTELDQLKSLEFFRYERNHSPMGEVIRQHLQITSAPYGCESFAGALNIGLGVAPCKAIKKPATCAGKACLTVVILTGWRRTD